MKSNQADTALQALEARIKADFHRHLGRTVTVRRVTMLEGSHARCRQLSVPATVRIVQTGDEQLLRYSTRDRITPEWRAELVGDHAEIPANAHLSVFGTSRQADGESFLSDIEDLGVTARLTGRLILLSFKGLSKLWPHRSVA
ncbi:hypothetical protein [Paraburkholderia sp. J8-2]|uniref:hypothetical protein n=1 Tax=Paraburkholderia sp. J8-2 TaxID=2805440 RepID=UPI002AB6E690|nr:hypothetical protein [Paraburkholderia sp. J8-2]